MREQFPDASESDVRIRALLFVVLKEMGNAFRKSLPLHVSVLNGLADAYPIESLR